MRFNSAALLLCSGFVASAGAQAPSPPASLDALIEQRMEESGIMGLAAAIIVDRKLVWTRGYGFSNYDRTRRFTPDTVMDIASVTKPFTGVAMMQAVQAGRLSLDADVSTYLPFRVVNPHRPGALITLRHLATHTSGITDRPEIYRAQYRFDGKAPTPLGSFLREYFTVSGQNYSPDNFLDALPGTRREYSNIGAGLAGYIVERTFGESLQSYTRKHIFAPLGMKNTVWNPKDVDPDLRTTLFVSQNGRAIPIQPYVGTTYPDGGVHTSVSDLSRFFIAMLSDGAYGNARILAPEMAAEMTRFQFNDGNRPENYPGEEGNSGLFWRTRFNGTRVGHGGNDPGVAALMLADLTGEIGIIVLANTSLADAEQRRFVDIQNAVWTRAEEMKANRSDLTSRSAPGVTLPFR